VGGSGELLAGGEAEGEAIGVSEGVGHGLSVGCVIAGWSSFRYTLLLWWFAGIVLWR
jgi:hypothetical protein